MRIALIVLTRGSVSGGFRKYIQRLIPLLRAHPDVERVALFVPPQMAAAGDATWPVRDEMTGFRTLKRSIAQTNPDVVFIPTARALRVGDKPVVTMVRNMEPLEVPFGGNTVAEGLKNVVRARAARGAARRSDRVIAVSRHVRQFIVDHWDIPEERIGTVYHGIDATHAITRPESIPEGRFLFTAGSIRPARGLEDVIVALKTLPDDVRLVIAGSVDRGAEHYDVKMRSLAEQHGVSSRIVWAGHLDAASVAWCFAHAAAFVMTSRAEACPNIVLEAMANRALSVSTDHPPMPEFFEDAALYYRERNADDLGAKLREALALTSDAREQLQEKSQTRASQFTWDATARATVEELKKAISRGAR